MQNRIRQLIIRHRKKNIIEHKNNLHHLKNVGVSPKKQISKFQTRKARIRIHFLDFDPQHSNVLMYHEN